MRQTRTDGLEGDAVLLWDEMWVAMALMLVFEGIIPFLSPSTLRRALELVAQVDDRTLRVSGLVSMVVGVLILYLARS